MKPWLSFIIAIKLGLLSSQAHSYEKVFYTVYQTQDSVKSSHPARIPKHKVTQLLKDVSLGKKNFIGFVDDDNTTIQFYVDAIGKIWVEIPFPNKQGSYGKHITTDEMHEIVSTLSPPYMLYKTKLNLHFEAW